MIRIGANPIGWSNDDLPELGGDIPLEQCLAEARAAGFTGMELGNKFPRDAARLRPVLEAHGLSLVSGWYSTRLIERDVEAEWAASRAHAQLLKEMRCNVFIAAECTGTVHGDRAKPLSQRPVMADTDWCTFATRLTGFAERLAREDGLTLAYHHHMGTVIQTGAEIDRLMTETGAAVTLLLDTGHATWAGVDPVTLARRYKSRITHVHTKDVRPAVMALARQNDWSFLQAVVAGVYTVPGDGTVDFTAVLAELKGFSGWIVVEAEQDPSVADPATYAALGYRNLQRFLARSGIIVGTT